MTVNEKLKIEIKKIKRENDALKNRCRALSYGAICEFCPFECRYKQVKEG